MKFLLDTDTCIYVLKQNPAVLQRLLAQSPQDITLSVITEAELRTGAAKSLSATKARWARFRAEKDKKAFGDSVVRKTEQVKKRVLSAAGRAKISKAAKARWAKIRAQAKKSVS